MGGNRYPDHVFKSFLPYFLVRIVGPSMQPALSNGELWLARKGVPKLESGQVVAFEHPMRPHLLEVKRLVREVDAGWWVEGDNQEFSTDSRTFGPINSQKIRGKLICRISLR